MKDVSRREALKAFAVVSTAGFLDVGVPQLERALRGMEELTQGHVDDASAQQSPYAPKFFNAREWRLVRMLADYVIPRDARSGSATDARVPEFMDVLLSDREASPARQFAMRGGLAWMDNESRRRFGRTFVSASDADRRQILDDIAWPARAKREFSHGVTFFNQFRDLTASGFFSSAMGWRDVQYMGNVFHHWDGCPPAALEKLGVTYDLMNTRVQSSQ